MKQALCVWCDKPADGMKLTHRTVIRKKDGAAVVIESGREHPACWKHLGIPTTEDPVAARARYARECKARKQLQERLF